jgi:hypothetical protein
MLRRKNSDDLGNAPENISNTVVCPPNFSEHPPIFFSKFSQIFFSTNSIETVPKEVIAEYDLDEQDEKFLSRLNFPQQILSKDQFEFMVDRFEAKCDQVTNSVTKIFFSAP